MIEDEGILLDFIQEAKEHLEGIENDLLIIEEKGLSEDGELINRVFRAIHSIKGGSGFFGLETIKRLAHVQENILNAFRNKELTPTSAIISVLLTSIDLLKKMVNDFRNSNSVNIEEELTKLKAFEKGAQPVAAAAKEMPKGYEFKENGDLLDLTAADGKVLLSIKKELPAKLLSEGSSIYLVEWNARQDLLKDAPLLALLENMEKTGQIIGSEIPLEEMKKWAFESKDTLPISHMLYATILEAELIHTLIPIATDRIRLFDQKSSFKGMGETSMPMEHPPAASPAAAAPEPAPASAPQEAPAQEAPAPEASPEAAKELALDAEEQKKATEAAQAAQATLRVPVKTLNTLMTLAGELVLTRNQLAEMIKIGDLAKIKDTAKRIDVVTSDLRMSIMGTRLQPLDRVFNKFTRVVRDLASQLGKKIDLTMEGKEVELDSTIIEMIGDPLTHLVRNAADHGIEMPQDRLKKGKRESGTLELKAYHEAGHVIIEIIDDGKGIDPEKIKAKAIKAGLYTKADLDRMDERDIVRIIFLPGFSLAEKVTEVSGRGVGMDVVLTNFTKLGGTVDIDSKIHKGSTIRVKLPLTMAIITGLIVSSEKENFVLPQANLLELIRVAPQEVKDKIKKIGDMSVLQLRGDLLPIVRLKTVLGVETFVDEEQGLKEERRKSIADQRVESGSHLPERVQERRSPRNSSLNIAVVGDEKNRFGLIVEEFLDTEEIVVKPLGNLLQSCEIYAGSTIRGDGKVALILDIAGISEKLNLAKIIDSRQENKALLQADLREVQPFLIVRNTEQEQFAIPLALISRIERVTRTSIEKIAGKISVRYRERSLPLISLQQMSSVQPLPPGDSCYILTFKVAKQEVGLMVAELVDAAETKNVVDATTFRQPGILGSFIWDECTTLLVDLFELAKQVYPELLAEIVAPAGLKKRRALVVDDSRFYRNQIKQFVENDLQFAVETAEDGQQGFEVLMKSRIPFDIVLTDIEMPVLDGYGLIRKIRSEETLKKLPICAITSLAGKESQEEAFRAGVDCYLVKLDREQLKSSVFKLLSKQEEK
ncbi:MAG: cheA2 [Chlamydiales bacterium]|jgi:two-component system chemotaxis sensor kinase CheA|nr:cheA2 [Chlamydiales bacterium]